MGKRHSQKIPAAAPGLQAGAAGGPPLAPSPAAGVPATAIGEARVPASWSVEDLARESGAPVALVRAEMDECYMPDEVFLNRADGNKHATAEGRDRILAGLDGKIRPRTIEDERRDLVAVLAERAAQLGKEPRSDAGKGQPAGPERDDLRITRIWAAKRVICNRASNGLEVVCRVQDTANLKPGMTLEAAQVGVDKIWSYYGRLPRRPGRW